MLEVPKIKLNNGLQLPAIVLQSSELEVLEIAIKIGFRHIHLNHGYFGKVFNEIMLKYGIRRENLYISSTFKPCDDFKAIQNNLKEILNSLNCEYLDLYVLEKTKGLTNENIEGLWMEMKQLQNQNLVKAIGVSNFDVNCLESMLKSTNIYPTMNKIKNHDEKLLKFLGKHGILTNYVFDLKKHTAILNEQQIKRFANIYEKTPLQIILRYYFQIYGLITLKNLEEKHLGQEILDFHLAPETMVLIKKLLETKNFEN